MIISLTATADSNNYQYSVPLTGGQSNPWAVPQVAENPPRFQQAPRYQNQQNQQYQGRSYQNKTYQADRFVTPEFLEALKQQQTQMQMMPDNGQIPQYAPEQWKLQKPGSNLPESNFPGPGSYTYPSYGMDYMDPLYDTPAVTPWSPWGIGVDAW